MEPFVIDLSKIEGEGDFSCPKCRVTISPDDDSGMTYDLLKSVEQDGLLEKVTIKCKTCRSTIKIEDFSLIKEIDNFEKIFELEDYLKFSINPKV